MSKLLKKIAAVFAVLALVGPAVASASVTPTNMLVNGDVHGSAASGDVVNLAVQFTNTGASTVQSVWVEIPGSGFPGECVDVLDENQVGSHTVNVNVNTLGTTEGQWTVTFHPYGFNRVTTGSQPTDTDCTNSQGSTKSFANQLKITNPVSTGDTANNTGNGGVNGNGNNNGGTGVNNGNDNNTGSGNSTSTPPAWFTAWLASWNASHPSTPSNTALCVAFKANLLSSSPNMRTPNNAVLQGFLIGALRSATNPTPIPALAQGASFGFYGPQTAAAVSLFQSTYNCQ